MSFSENKYIYRSLSCFVFHHSFFQACSSLKISLFVVHICCSEFRRNYCGVMDLRRKDSLFICLSVLIVQVVCQQVELSPESHHVDKKVFGMCKKNSFFFYLKNNLIYWYHCVNLFPNAENPALHHVVVHFMDLKRTDVSSTFAIVSESQNRSTTPLYLSWIFLVLEFCTWS